MNARRRHKEKQARSGTKWPGKPVHQARRKVFDSRDVTVTLNGIVFGSTGRVERMGDLVNRGSDRVAAGLGAGRAPGGGDGLSPEDCE